MSKGQRFVLGSRLGLRLVKGVGMDVNITVEFIISYH